MEHDNLSESDSSFPTNLNQRQRHRIELLQYRQMLADRYHPMTAQEFVLHIEAVYDTPALDDAYDYLKDIASQAFRDGVRCTMERVLMPLPPFMQRAQFNDF